MLANIVPVEREILKYRKYARPFSPIRFLNLLPLSHMFGQSMATFIPPMLAGTVSSSTATTRTTSSARSRRAASRCSCRCRRSSTCCASTSCAWRRIAPRCRRPGEHFTAAMVALPRRPSRVRLEVLELRRRRGAARSGARGVLGTARLRRDSGLRPHRDRADRQPQSPVQHEQGIGRQGDRRRRGEDRDRRRDPRPRRQRHERLLQRDAATAEAFEDGWFHTGDIGEVDAQGRLFIKGRKKEMIVTPEGLNVFPEDVERVVAAVPGVRDVAVVGARTGSEERVHAVVVAAIPASIRGRRAAGQPRRCSTIRRSAASRCGRGRAAADGGHAQAETARDARLGGHRCGAASVGVGRRRRSRRCRRAFAGGRAGHLRRPRSTSSASARSSASS